MSTSSQAGNTKEPTQSSQSDTHASVGTSSTPNTNNQTSLRLRPPRSLPPWIDSYEHNDGTVTDEQLRLLQRPEPSVQPQHNTTPAEPQRRVSKDGFVDLEDQPFGHPRDPRGHIPHFLRYGRASRRGRKWDHLRSAEPVIISGYGATKEQSATGWRDFIQSSAWGRMPNEESEVVSPEAWNKLQPTFNQPLRNPVNRTDSNVSRRTRTLAFSKRLWNLAIRHSLAPLVFRLTVMITSIVALGIACKIYELEVAAHVDVSERAQSIVSIAVDSVAIPYIGYMLWDEYTGKPLGLRPAVSKIALILLDLFFIIFKSASTALAFESLVYHNIKGSRIRDFARSLAAFQLIGLIAWCMNFTVNIFRTVERLGGGDDDSSH